ncbi:MAG: NAD(P)/FAD-dependent oxidoreductase [Bdellovibrionota bacterium]
MSKKTKKIVILGGGFAGLNVAKHLGGKNVHVTLMDRTNHHVFQPLLYQVATAGLSPADIAMPIRKILSKAKNVHVVMDEVVHIETMQKKVYGKTQVVSYDKLVIATGATHSYFGKNHWSQFAPGLKTIPDATRLRSNILNVFEQAENQSTSVAREVRFAIVGGGPTGVEMAGAIAELARRVLAKDFRNIDPSHTKVDLIEASDRILASFPKKLSEKAAQSLEKLGVSIKTQSKVEDLGSDRLMINGKSMAYDCIVWAAGVQASPIVEWLDIDVPHNARGQIKVDSQFALECDADVYIIGDACDATDSTGKQLPGLASVALQEGKYVGQRLQAWVEDQTFSKPFVYVDKGNLATIGRSKAVAQIKRWMFSGFFAWIVWLVIHILYLIGFQNKTLVLTRWAWNYLAFEYGARLITDTRRASSNDR